MSCQKNPMLNELTERINTKLITVEQVENILDDYKTKQRNNHD